MTHPSKRKGNSWEREVVNAAKAIGLEAKRAYASNGESLGYSPEVDVDVEGQRVQCKIRKTLPAYLQIPEGCDAVAFRQSRGEPMMLISRRDWLAMLHYKRTYEQLVKKVAHGCTDAACEWCDK